MTKIFLTGATGYVGGETLHTLSNSTSNPLEITALIRDESKAAQVLAAHPTTKIIIGDLDDTPLLTSQAEAADIVINLASTSHAPSAKAIATGLQNRANRTGKPGHWIQISGATCYAASEISSGHFGYPSSEVYDDVKDKSAILTLLRDNPKRVVENTVLAQKSEEVKTALVIGPLIYGVGRGPVNQRSIQAPEIAKATIGLGHGIAINEGKNVWSNIHVSDLASLIHKLVDAAIEGKEGVWGEQGVYNVEGGELAFATLGQLIADKAHGQGLIPHSSNDEFEAITAERADELSGHASVLWGTNARTRASRARKLLGWETRGLALQDTLEDLVRREGGAI
ncbi:NAD(P)-binding protein [Plenodomus tracheiphilus IPT5]|uniref:NAD(P)-binding protein n=1 Tax=Plenodomus tracheiphilus IPT5 TaxID=1408161 RepID=A0A6A7AVJ6_9PLEO|nr:NAD(P)-binding protein [Plenodomus tracheiphilus IPT5]